MRRALSLSLLVALVLLGTVPVGADAGPASGGVLRGDLGSARGDPRSAARAALERHEDALGVDADAFAFESVRRSIVGVHVRGREFRNGVPVDGSSAAVHVVDGRVVQIEARRSPLAGRPATNPVSRATAIRTASAATGASDASSVVGERLLVELGGRLADAWRVSVFSLDPAVAATVDVGAASGDVLAVRDERVFADGSATVFDPNAVVAARNPNLREPVIEVFGVDADLDAAELTAALTTLPLREFDPTFFPAGRIVGPWVDVRGHGPHIGTTLDYTRGDKRFEGPMAYAHLDRLQRYFQALGFTGAAGVNAEPQDVYTIRIEGFDNSFYMPAQDLIAFGAGGVDDAEDAEVVVHEYGHAIHDAQVPGWGARHEGRAMGEGFGDWLAGNYYAGSISGGFQDACIADWDATSYSSDDPPCLRRLDEDKHYPEDMTNSSVHADGEIWSAFLWTVRNNLPTKNSGRLPLTTLENAKRLPNSEIKTGNSMKLVLTSHEFLTPTADFGDGVAALLLAADALGHPEWRDVIVRAANRYGLPLS